MTIATAMAPFWLASFILCILCNSAPTSATVVAADELVLDVSQINTLELWPKTEVGNSPGVKPGVKVHCERLKIQGFPRLSHLKKYPYTLKIKVAYVGYSDVEVCFHRNSSVGIGMCGQSHWEKLNKGTWMGSMSPFDHMLLDVRLVANLPQPIDLSLQEEVFFHRVILLVLGVVMMTLATFLSKSLVFYHCGSMAVGALLVILIVIFQLVVFLLLFLEMTVAWLGFWIVRKLVLTEDGSIDVGVSYFVAWSIRILASVMILQSTVDPLLAAEALISAILISSILRGKFFRRLYRNFPRRLSRLTRGGARKLMEYFPSPVAESRTPKPFIKPSVCDTFYSTFHTTPERRKLSKDEWNELTRESTKSALEALVSSPDFGKWAVAHAGRLTLAPEKEPSKRKWFHWF